jgi:hypothetical protein
MKTFTLPARPLPAPFVPPTEKVRGQAAILVASIMAWAVPEDYAAASEAGVVLSAAQALLDRDPDEIAAWVDVMAATMGE